jgi:hypothetical protein
MGSCYSNTFEPVERLLLYYKQERSACVFAVSTSGLPSVFGLFPALRFLPGFAGSMAHALLDGREDEVWLRVWLLHCFLEAETDETMR